MADKIEAMEVDSCVRLLSQAIEHVINRKQEQVDQLLRAIGETE